MNNRLLMVIAPAALLVACGAAMSAPTQRLADAQSAQRAAQELGAAKHPSAQLHMRLAEEQMAEAKALMSEGENERADALLVRAKADSELAVALAREQKAALELQQASKQAKATMTTIQGAGQ